MLLTSGWEAGGGEFFCSVPRRGWITLNLKSPEIDSKRRGQLRLQRHLLFPAQFFSFWALCVTLSMMYSVVFRWRQRYFTSGEKNKWWLIFLLVQIKLELALQCDARIVSFPFPFTMLHRSYTIWPPGLMRECVVLADALLYVCLELPTAVPVGSGWCGWKGGSTALVVKVLPWFPVHTCSHEKSLWRIKTVFGQSLGAANPAFFSGQCCSISCWAMDVRKTGAVPISTNRKKILGSIWSLKISACLIKLNVKK